MSFGRREPLHERLAREGGLAPHPPPHDPGPHWGEVGIHGLHRAREWDALVSVRAELPGDAARFVALPDGSLLVEEGPDGEALAALADALEDSVEPPYRAEAVRRERGVWAVAANRIDIVELADDPGGDVLQLVRDETGLTLRIDDAPTLTRIRELEALGSARFATYVVEAARLDGALWEAVVVPL